jgi:hypothetical protein
MATLTRDHYIYSMTKQASDELGPDYGVDNAVQANKEHTQNQGDTRTTLRGLFANAGAVESGNSRTVDSLLPRGGASRETSNPLMKLAFQSFLDELQKIAGSIASGIKQVTNESILGKMQALTAARQGVVRASGKAHEIMAGVGRPAAPKWKAPMYGAATQ